MHADKVELEAWRQAAFVLILLAAFVFLVQRLFGPIFNDVVFEICIFYVPAVTIALLYLYFKTKLSAKTQLEEQQSTQHGALIQDLKKYANS